MDRERAGRLIDEYLDGELGPEGETRVGSISSFGGPVTVRGTLRGDIGSFGGPVTVHGTVHGDIASFGGAVSLKSGSRVVGDIATFGAPVTKHPEAEHSGQVVGLGGGVGPWRMSRPHAGDGGAHAVWVIGTVLSLTVVVLVGAISPKATRTVADSIIQQPGSAAGHGLVVLVLLLPLCLLLIITGIGALAVPLLLLVLLAAAVLGGVAVDLVIGRWLTRRGGWSIGSIVGLAVVGSLALQVLNGLIFLGPLALIPVLAGLAVLVFGLGGVLMTGFGQRPDGHFITSRLGNGAAADRSAAGQQPSTGEAQSVESVDQESDGPEAADAPPPPEAGPAP